MRTERPEFPAAPPETVAGIMLIQERQSVVMAGLQVAAGEATVSMAAMERQLSEFARALDYVRKLLQGGDGEQSLMFRTAMLEKAQQAMAEDMKEHRQLVEGQLTRLTKSHEEQTRLEREQRDRTVQLLVGFLVQIVLAGAAIVFALLKK